MEILGKMMVCNRCGRQKFLNAQTVRFLGIEHLEYEDAKNWTYSKQTGDLCPDCSSTWRAVRDKFMKREITEEVLYNA